MPPSTSAQITFGNEVRRESSAALLGLVASTFRPDQAPTGIDSLLSPLAFDHHAFNIAYSRSNTLISFTWGQQPANAESPVDNRLIDLTLQLWTEMFFSPEAVKAAHRVFVPISVVSNYRDLSPSGVRGPQSFQRTSFGLGVGAGYYGQITPKALLEIRSSPELLVAFQSFGGTAGWTRIFDTNVELHLGPFVGNTGVSLGYSFRSTFWDLRQQNSFGGLPDFNFDPIDYREQRHTVSLGVNW